MQQLKGLKSCSKTSTIFTWKLLQFELSLLSKSLVLGFYFVQQLRTSASVLKPFWFFFTNLENTIINLKISLRSKKHTKNCTSNGSLTIPLNEKKFQKSETLFLPLLSSLKQIFHPVPVVHGCQDIGRATKGFLIKNGMSFSKLLFGIIKNKNTPFSASHFFTSDPAWS